MAIPESQFVTWSHQGASSTAKNTADSLKNALNSFSGWPDNIKFDVYLQGSYKNDTNIRGDSDVDVVAQLNSTIYSNLSEEQYKMLGFKDAPYNWSDFKRDVLRVLKEYYSGSQITEGNNSIKIKADSGRLPADVVVCSQYRQYKTVNQKDYIEGMCFWTKNESRQVINYPKVHYENGVAKHQNSNSWYKPIVRIFKNCRGSIQGDNTPSYFLECTLYNTANSLFGESYQKTYCNIVNWLSSADLEKFNCQNGQMKLFGSTLEQWNLSQAQKFIQNLVSLYNSW